MPSTLHQVIHLHRDQADIILDSASPANEAAVDNQVDARAEGCRLARQKDGRHCSFGRKDFLPVEAQGSLSFLFRLSEPRFA
jgi:hypothetical protein